MPAAARGGRGDGRPGAGARAVRGWRPPRRRHPDVRPPASTAPRGCGSKTTPQPTRRRRPARGTSAPEVACRACSGPAWTSVSRPATGPERGILTDYGPRLVARDTVPYPKAGIAVRPRQPLVAMAPVEEGSMAYRATLDKMQIPFAGFEAAAVEGALASDVRTYEEEGVRYVAPGIPAEADVRAGAPMRFRALRRSDAPVDGRRPLLLPGRESLSSSKLHRHRPPHRLVRRQRGRPLDPPRAPQPRRLRCERGCPPRRPAPPPRPLGLVSQPTPSLRASGPGGRTMPSSPSPTRTSGW